MQCPTRIHVEPARAAAAGRWSGVATLLFAMIFELMPTSKVEWRDVWVDAAVTALLFEVGKFLIGLYLGKSGLEGAFAGAG